MDNSALIITAQAQTALHRFKNAQGKPVRLAINPGGCSGFDIAFSADDPRADDVHLGAIEAPLIIDSLSLSLIAGATLDYVDQIGKEGFVVTNIPNTEARCGCGKSFSLVE